MPKLEANVSQMKDRLRLWDAKLDVLMARAEVAGAQAKMDHRNRIDDIKARRELAKAKMAEFGAAGSEKWASFKAGMEVAWKDLGDALKGD